MSAKFLLKKLVPFLLISVVFSTSSWAQGQPGVVAPPQGTPMVSGTPFQSVNNACDKYGVCNFAVTGSGGGATQSVIPVSNATGLNGVGALGVGVQFMVSDAVEAASTTTVINATTHTARVGDVLSFRTGTAANIGTWSTVSATTTNTITISNALPATPAAADSFYILRPQPLSVNPNTGNASVNSLNVVVAAEGQISNAGSLLKLEDVAAASGDALVGVAAIVDNTVTGGKAGAGDYTGIAVSDAGTVVSALVLDPSITFAKQAVKAEDAAAASGDALVGVAAVIQNPPATGFGGSANDYGHLVTDNAATLYVRANEYEDVALGDGQNGFVALTQTQDPLSVDQGTTGDKAVIKVDRAGRTITTKAPKGEMIRGCNTAVTTNTTGQIFAGAASKFSFVTSWDCTNTGATATRVILEDADGTDLANGFLPATTGSFHASLSDIPAYSEVVNKAIQVNVITTGSSTICCARGYYGVQ